MASQIKKEKKDIQGSGFIKDENGNILVEQYEVAERWRYFQKLLNEYENQIEEFDVVEGPIEIITETEVRNTINKMKDKRATGPSGVSAEMFKAMEGVDVREVTPALQQISQESRMPDSWNYSSTIALFRGKGDALACNKYRGLRLLGALHEDLGKGTRQQVEHDNKHRE